MRIGISVQSADEADATGGAVIRAGHRGFPPEACVVGDQAKAVCCVGRLADVKTFLR